MNGDTAAARVRWSEYATLVDELDQPLPRLHLVQCAGALDLAEGNANGAVRWLSEAWRLAKTSRNPVAEPRVLIGLAAARLAAGDVAGALRATTRATRLHRAQGYPRLDLGRGQELWWRHGQALAASGRDDEAWAALQQAHALMLEGVRSVRDDGLRRSFLGKVSANRGLLRDWLHESRRRGGGAQRGLRPRFRAAPASFLASLHTSSGSRRKGVMKPLLGS